jgi:hypothetical protein
MTTVDRCTLEIFPSNHDDGGLAPTEGLPRPHGLAQDQSCLLWGHFKEASSC